MQLIITIYSEYCLFVNEGFAKHQSESVSKSILYRNITWNIPMLYRNIDTFQIKAPPKINADVHKIEMKGGILQVVFCFKIFTDFYDVKEGILYCYECIYNPPLSVFTGLKTLFAT